MNTGTIDKMTRQEKRKTMEALWDALSHDEHELASPSWHGEILAARRSKIESGAATFVPLNNLKAAQD